MNKPTIDSKFKKTYLVHFNVGTNHKQVPMDEMISDEVSVQVLSSADGVPFRYAAVSGDTNINGICIWQTTDTHSQEKPALFTAPGNSLIEEEIPTDRMLETEEIANKEWLRREIYLELMVVSTDDLYNPADAITQHAKLFDVIVPVLGYNFQAAEEKYPEFDFEDGTFIKVTGFGVTGDKLGFIPEKFIQEVEERTEAANI